MSALRHWQMVFSAPFLLSYQGRVSRGQNAVFFLVCYLLSLLADSIDLALGWYFSIPIVSLGVSAELSSLAAQIDPGLALLQLGKVQCLLALALIYPSSCVSIKREHDLNHSGWRSFLLLISIVGVAWLLIEMFFVAGTPGPNRHGPDPRKRP